jgi:hypothetical protein
MEAQIAAACRLSILRSFSCYQHREANCKQANLQSMTEGASHLVSPERVKSGNGFVHPRVLDDLDDTAVCPTDTETNDCNNSV